MLFNAYLFYFVAEVDDKAQQELAKENSKKMGYVLAVGENISNQLGLGFDICDRKKPQLVKGLPNNVIQVASGGMHSACLTADGDVCLIEILIFII